MKCQDIYKAALRLIGENGREDRTADYLERTPYILANAVSDLKTLDGYYRKAHSLPERTEVPGTEVCLPLSEDFPLADRFMGAVSAYLASILLVDENTSLSDKFYDRFCMSVTAITGEIPAETEKILERYS